ncbi:MAG: hypothetical protein FJX77_08455 [Armatimonadetes bacterium]|nr:hypothetical protein [Armatimonadota bacterium]
MEGAELTSSLHELGLVRPRGATAPAVGAMAERRLVAPRVTPAQLKTQRLLASLPCVKIGVRSEGWYRITGAELLANGLPPGTKARQIQLLAEGIPQLIRTTGLTDGRVDPGDVIEFYGVGADTPHTDTRVYWLAPLKGRVLSVPTSRSRSRTPGASVTPYPIEFRERFSYVPTLLNGDRENFFGRPITTATTGLTLATPFLDGGAGLPGLLELSLQGITDTPAPGLDHRVEIRVNGAPVGTIDFDGRGHPEHRFPLAPTLLRPGANEVTFTAQNGETDVSLLDTVRLTYPRALVAEGNQLRFLARGGQYVTVRGFTTRAIRVFDVTDPAEPFQVVADSYPEAGGFAVRIHVAGTADADRLLLALGTVGSSPAWVRSNVPSAWSSSSPAAALTLVTHGTVRQGATTLADYRRRQGQAVNLVDVEDLYDEYTFGSPHPAALRNYLAELGAARRLQNVLLFGDASFDPRNYLGRGEPDLLPTRLTAVGTLETASDDWFCDFNEDGIADAPLGRLPAGSAAQGVALAEKLIAYETGPVPGTREAFLLADEDNGFGFSAGNRLLFGLLPASIAGTAAAWSPAAPGAARTALLSAIARSQLVVNYLGHGSEQAWAHGVQNPGEAGLWTGARPPLLVAMTCLNGYFQEPGQPCLAEALVGAPTGGAIAAWASSGLTRPTGQLEANLELYRALFGSGLPLGQAVQRAKAATTDPTVRRSWNLLGDPLLRIR